MASNLGPKCVLSRSCDGLVDGRRGARGGVFKLKGCTAVFFHSDGTITAADVQIGQECYETRYVAREVRLGGSRVTEIVICSQDSSIVREVKEAFKKELSLNSIDDYSLSYSYNPIDRMGRHAF